MSLKQSTNNNGATNSNYVPQNCLSNSQVSITNTNLNTNYSSSSNSCSTNALVQLNDVDYINSINEVTFFEHVKRALRTPDVYKNFLRCIALFNQEVVTSMELIKLAEPFLG